MGFLATLIAGIALAGTATVGVVVTVQSQAPPAVNIQQGQLPQTAVPQYGQQ